MTTMTECTTWECSTTPAPGRPWCGDHEPLSVEEQTAYAERRARRAAANEKWGTLAGVPGMCRCGLRAEPDKDTCADHRERCQGMTTNGSGGRCKSNEFVDGFCRTHHPKRKQLDQPLAMADPTTCFECGRPTCNVDATCWPCRTAAL